MRIKHDDHYHEVYLSDDGTMDTVIEVDGQDFRFDGEHASHYRGRDGAFSDYGFRRFAKSEIDSICDDIAMMEAEDV